MSARSGGLMVYSKIIRCTSIAYFEDVMLETLLIIVNTIVNSNDKFSKILPKLQYPIISTK